ncbi:hypothetical protein KIN20_028482 [Parelaphostrongylus tenuis]|uniref:F-box domain-containing protein n=1 Tax=Parelaphostrongylus tenuis TaxID=148309 RepID=A0AAD5R1B7_PARTN|nr:hypothetical protein KIN20_028482 [Parelaphostrongylus tenuis]
MIPIDFPLSDDVIFRILQLLEGKDVRSFGNICRRFRRLILQNKGKLPTAEITWHEAYLEFGSKIILRRSEAHSAWQQKQRETSSVVNRWIFTKNEFLSNFANLFVVISPNVMHVTCKRLDEHTAQIIRKSIGNMWGKKFCLRMDDCSLGENALRSLFTHISPFALHLTGKYDRSVISDQVLPLSTLFSLYIDWNEFDLKMRTRISVMSLRKILNNWFERYSDDQSVRPIEDYENKDFLIKIPKCVIDYNDFIEFFKKLTRCPHGTYEKIYMFDVPKTLILAIAKYLSTLDQWPQTWVEEGLCSWNNVQRGHFLSCHCHGIYADDLPSDASQLCDRIKLYSTASVYVPQWPGQQTKRLLHVNIVLNAF